MPRSVQVRKILSGAGWTHLVQGGQEGAEHEGRKYDGEVVLGQDMGFAVFPSSTRLCLLSPRMSGRTGGGLG